MSMSIGLQLYTVREELSKDFKGTLKTLSSIGFQGVEFAWNYGGMEPEELSDFLKNINLKCIGLYSPVAQIEDSGSDAYKYAEALNSPYFTSGITDKTNEAEWPGAIESIKKAAKISSSKGITFLYHNHWQEFEKINGKYALDILMDETDPNLVKVELDTAWVKKGGDDPVAYIKKYAGRLPMLHVKDIDAENNVTEIGNGVVDFPEVIKAAKESGVEWIVNEQDSSSIGAIKSAGINFNNLMNLL